MLLSRRGTLAEQVNVSRDRGRFGSTAAAAARDEVVGCLAARPDLEFFNGLGGFAADGREYVTILGEGQWTPAPWINVIANPAFGFQVSESGSGYTWSLNSRENQLTPWSNDPVSDPPGETIYVRDEDSGELWGPTVLPIREEAWPIPLDTARATAASNTRHTGSRLTPAVRAARGPDQDFPAHLRESLRPTETSLGDGVCRVGARRFAEPPRPSLSPRSTGNRSDVRTQRLEQRVRGRVAFADLGGRQSAWTGDRTEFLGRNGTLDHPMSLERGDRLSGRVGAGLDPCAALQTTIELRAGGRAEIVFSLARRRPRKRRGS